MVTCTLFVFQTVLLWRRGQTRHGEEGVVLAVWHMDAQDRMGKERGRGRKVSRLVCVRSL